MKNADRLLRIAYKEMPLSFLEGRVQACLAGTALAPGLSLFCLNDASFVDEMIKSYLAAYPINYNKEEVEQIICGQAALAKKYSYDKNPNILHLFLHYADKLLHLDDNELRLCFDDLFEWDGFVDKVDSLVLKAAFLSRFPCDINVLAPPMVRHDEERLYKILQKGISENHMHFNGSGYNWYINWQALAAPEEDFFKLAHIIKPLQKTLHLESNSLEMAELYILKIRLMRLYLLADENEWCDDIGCDILRFLDCQSPLFILKYSNSINTLHSKITLSIKNRLCLPNNYNNLPQAPLRAEQRLFENVFTRLRSGLLSHCCTMVANFYIYAMCHVKSYFVQDNLGMGFDKFKKIEEAKELFFNEKKGDKKRLYESVFDRYYSEKCVKQIELRFAPKSSKKQLAIIKKELDYANTQAYSKSGSGAKQGKKINHAAIIHYIKNNKVEYTRNECRHYKLRYQLKNSARVLVKYYENVVKLEKADALLSKTVYEDFIVGIDAANYEIGCPPEVFAVEFRRQKEAISFHHKLGLTFHVGEDFLGLAAGLRVIAEVLEYMNYQSGDRLGHATAIGINVQEYLGSKRKFIVTDRQGHVDDIAFMHNIIFENDKGENGYILAWLEKEFDENIMCLVDGRNYGFENIRIGDYALSMALRADEPSTYSIYDEIKKADPYDKADSLERNVLFNVKSEKRMLAGKSFKARILNHLYQYDKSFYEKGRESLTLSVCDEYAKALELAQKALRKKIYNLRVIIEKNPTSNKKISHSSKYSDVPIQALNSHGLTNRACKSKAGLPDIPICINTDDSAIFQTDLSNEYSCTALSLLKEGYDVHDVWGYIETLRQASLLSSFIRL